MMVELTVAVNSIGAGHPGHAASAALSSDATSKSTTVLAWACASERTRVTSWRGRVAPILNRLRNVSAEIGRWWAARWAASSYLA
jgi:hypothetical protein